MATSKQESETEKQLKEKEKSETETQLKEWKDYVLSWSLVRRGRYIEFEPSSISIVPERLKKWNEDAYSPRVVSIGPRHRGTREELRQMEETKWRCMLSLFHRGKDKATRCFDKCIQTISALEARVRASYTGDLKFNEVELTKMMLVDGGFLLELLISQSTLDDELPSRYPLAPTAELLKDEQVLLDLMLLENQIPIHVLHKLSHTIFPEVFKNDDVKSVTELNNSVLSLLRYPLPHVPNPEASHFLALVYSSVHKKDEIVLTIDAESHCDKTLHVLKLRRCAAMLQAQGITISLKPSSFNDLVSNHDMEITFSNGKLEIPQLHITDTAKSKWLNGIAWEHHLRNRKNRSPGPDSISQPAFGRFTSAALIFDGLICCPADVRLLKSKRIIVDHLEMDNEDFKAFFSSIPKGIDQDVMDCRYVEMLDDLNKHSTSNCMVRILLTLWHYFVCHVERVFKFMRKDYNFAVTVVPLFTIAQTVYTAMQYYHSNNPPSAPPPPQRQ